MIFVKLFNKKQLLIKIYPSGMQRKRYFKIKNNNNNLTEQFRLKTIRNQTIKIKEKINKKKKRKKTIQ